MLTIFYKGVKLVAFIFYAIICVVIIIVLFLSDKFAHYSDMMSSFSEKSYKKTITLLSIAAVMLVSYGIYYEITYQPPFVHIVVDGKRQTVFGDVGDLGYYTEGLIHKNEKSKLYFVSWEELDLKGSEIVVEYPSGEKERWDPDIRGVDASIESPTQYGEDIRTIYQASPYEFQEERDVELTIMKSGETLKEIEIDVR